MADTIKKEKDKRERKHYQSRKGSPIFYNLKQWNIMKQKSVNLKKSKFGNKPGNNESTREIMVVSLVGFTI
jgi:hypothetical protein